MLQKQLCIVLTRITSKIGKAITSVRLVDPIKPFYKIQSNESNYTNNTAIYSIACRESKNQTNKTAPHWALSHQVKVVFFDDTWRHHEREKARKNERERETPPSRRDWPRTHFSSKTKRTQIYSPGGVTWRRGKDAAAGFTLLQPRQMQLRLNGSLKVPLRLFGGL